MRLLHTLKNSTVLRNFAADKRGSAYVLAALSMVPLFAMTALAIDYTNMDRIKSDLETATDTVALHVAKRVALNPNMTSPALITEGKNILSSMMPGTTVQYDRFDIEANSGVVRIESKAVVNTHFMHAFGHPTLTAQSKSQAQFGRREVEVAIAIDNSGSMAWLTTDNKVRMTATKAAARTLIEAATESVEELENASIKFSVVPWHTHVSLPANQTTETNGTPKWWIDWDGYSTTHFRHLPPYKFTSNNSGAANGDLWVNFPKRQSNWPTTDNDEHVYYDPNLLAARLPLEVDGNGVNLAALKALSGVRVISRKNVFAAFTNATWNGCFEHRAGDYRYSFDEPTKSNWQNPSLDPQFDGDSLFVPHFAPDEYDYDDYYDYYWGGHRNDYVYDLGGESDYVSSDSDDKKHLTIASKLSQYTSDDIIRARTNNTAKYKVSTTTRNRQHPWGYPVGPNGLCNTAKVLPLTDDIDAIHDAIDDMTPNGGTDLSIGLEWAMHSLTPWEPLAQGGSFKDAQKIMVFMTDGDNSAVIPDQYVNSYQSFGYMRDDPFDKGWSDAGPSATQANALLDEATKEYCTAIKNRGVKLYFIYFGDASANAQDVAAHCASTPETLILATNAAQLETAFRKIGDDIGKLRLTNYTQPED